MGQEGEAAQPVLLAPPTAEVAEPEQEAMPALLPAPPLPCPHKLWYSLPPGVKQPHCDPCGSVAPGAGDGFVAHPERRSHVTSELAHGLACSSGTCDISYPGPYQ